MNNTDTKLNVLPGLAATARLIGLAALIAAIVKTNQNSGAATSAAESVGRCPT